MSAQQIRIFVILIVTLVSLAHEIRAGEWVNGTASSATGSRNYSLWVPSGYDKRKPAPLVMMLHGCMQKPRDLATTSGMNTVADKHKFLVVYPEQTKEANGLQCWNWFDTKHQLRDSGEPSILAAIVQQIGSSHRIDAKRIYVAGISAGAAMAVVMGVTYPDVFSAIGVSSGLAFKAGTDVQGGLTVMKQGGPDPTQQALLAFKAMGKNFKGKSARRMPVIVFHGDADPYLNPVNAEQVIVQWATTNDYLDDGRDNGSVKSTSAKLVQGVVPAGHSFTRYLYNDRSGRLLLEKWIVKGLGHAWSGSPAAGPFGDPKGPNASEEMWRFFGETSRASHR
ncbi:MAG: PHB depolymerase family esterase [Pyrinomonadaceae bacterium]|nr:PHB depolymerase family esterase [Pyrinomonadaceae bacterium]